MQPRLSISSVLLDHNGSSYDQSILINLHPDGQHRICETRDYLYPHLVIEFGSFVQGLKTHEVYLQTIGIRCPIWAKRWSASDRIFATCADCAARITQMLQHMVLTGAIHVLRVHSGGCGFSLTILSPYLLHSVSERDSLKPLWNHQGRLKFWMLRRDGRRRAFTEGRGFCEILSISDYRELDGLTHRQWA